MKNEDEWKCGFGINGTPLTLARYDTKFITRLLYSLGRVNTE